MSTLSLAQAEIAALSLSISYCEPAALKPAANSLRKHPPAQIRKLMDGMRQFGMVVPILIDGDNTIVAGEARLQAAKKLGLTRIPTIRLEHLSDAQVAAFRIADNRLSELSSWNDQALAVELQDLSLLNLDFSLELTGFDMGEIDLRIDAISIGPAKEKTDPADAAPEVAAGPAVSQPGDLWLMGRHRLLNGNALAPESYTALMDGQKAAMVITDPPYNVPIQGHVSGLGAIRHREFAMATGEMSEAEFTAFLRQTCTMLAENSVDGSLHYICMDWRHLHELQTAARDVGLALKNLCVWAKDNGGMGSLYRSQHELVLVYKSGTAPHRNNVQLGRHGRNRSNVWSYPGVNSFRRNSEEGDLLALHPTVKPVKLIADAILDASARGDVVLDPFLGSGTTLLAAERVGRRCFGLELDPLYVDTIIRRWQAWTGDTARHAETGQTFAEREALPLIEGDVP